MEKTYEVKEIKSIFVSNTHGLQFCRGEYHDIASVTLPRGSYKTTMLDDQIVVLKKNKKPKYYTKVGLISCADGKYYINDEGFVSEGGKPMVLCIDYLLGNFKRIVGFRIRKIPTT